MPPCSAEAATGVVDCRHVLRVSVRAAVAVRTRIPLPVPRRSFSVWAGSWRVISELGLKSEDPVFSQPDVRLVWKSLLPGKSVSSCRFLWVSDAGRSE